MSVRDVYDFRGELEPAITKVLTDNVLTALSAQDPQTFQKERARVEVMFVLGAGKQGHLAMSEVTGLEIDVEDAWAGQLHLAIITMANADIHMAYEAQTRCVMSRLPALINNVPGGVVNHPIFGPVQHLGSAPTQEPEQGVYRTDMQYGFAVSIHADAWKLLNAGASPYRYYSWLGAQWRTKIDTGVDEVFGYQGDSLWHVVTYDPATGDLNISEQGNP